MTVTNAHVCTIVCHHVAPEDLVSVSEDSAQDNSIDSISKFWY